MTSIGLTFLAVAVVVLPTILTAFFALEVFAGLRPLSSFLPPQRDFGPAVIVIPAHDEEAVIARTVTETLAQSGGDFRLIVVADNCTDATVHVARSSGATVIERNDPDRKGKGYALAAAREHLRTARADVVVVLDADCRIDHQSLRALAAGAGYTCRPCQAVNLLAPDLSTSPLVQLSTFAFMVKNLIRQRSLQRLAGRAHLTGTGMAFPWTIFAKANLGGSNIVEDLTLGLELAERAAPPMLVPNATVWSPSAPAPGTLVQRRRWEGGYLTTAIKAAPRALLRGLRRGDWPGVVGALNLCVPPLALLVLMDAAALAIAALAFLAGAALWPVIVEVVAGAFAATAVILAWVCEGRRFASGATLLRLPFYVLWKLPMYVGLAHRGAPKEWLRTGR
jgi:cellulose synthase/poly-beta-1,6-N-acetylglucosamine synthase-like glycosyltransferase